MLYVQGNLNNLFLFSFSQLSDVPASNFAGTLLVFNEDSVTGQLIPTF